MLTAIPILLAAVSAQEISVYDINGEISYSISPNLTDVIGKTINQTLQNEPSLNVTKILVNLEDAINGELNNLRSSLEKLNPLQIGGVLEKSVNKINNLIGDYDDKLTSDLDNTVGNFLGIL